MRYPTMMLPWETFADQARRELRERDTDERWTDDLVAECRAHALEYASQLTGNYVEDIVLKHALDDMWASVPYHLRGEVFDEIKWR